MYYYGSNGATDDNNIHEYETMITTDGGVQFVLDLQASPRQIIYLDFDGELTKYCNADLDLEINDVQVEDSMVTPDRIAGIIATLNTNFSVYNVLFTAERPKDSAYSTIFVGKTSAFDQYGAFAGLAETVDHGNRIKDDNAFVLLNASASDSDIVSTIAHEAEHLLGTLDHGGNGMNAFACIIYNQTITGPLPGLESAGYFLLSSSTIHSSSCGLDNCEVQYSYSVASSYHFQTSTMIQSNAWTIDCFTDGKSGYYEDGGSSIHLTVTGDSFVSCDDANLSDTVIEAGTLWQFNGTVSDTSVYDGYIYTDGGDPYNGGNGLFVFGGKNKNTVVYNGGIMYCQPVIWYSGGSSVSGPLEVIENTTIENGGSFYIDRSKNGEAPIASSVRNNGFIQNAGIINDLIIYSAGSMNCHGSTFVDYVYPDNPDEWWYDEPFYIYDYYDGIASDIKIHPNGRIGAFIQGGNKVGYIAEMSGDYVVGTTNDLFISGTLLIGANGVAQQSEVLHGGSLYISRQGAAANTVVDGGGYMVVSSGGNAANTVVCKNGGMNVLSGSTATEINAAAGAHFTINVAENTYITGTYGNNAFEMKNAFISGYAVYEGGILHIKNRGTARSTTVNNGGSMCLSSGGRHTGTLTIAAGAVVSAYSGSVVEMDVANRTTQDPAIINDISRISGTPSYTLTVPANLVPGAYKLAGNAAGFSQNITIKAENGATGTFQWNQSGYNTVTLNGRDYTLNLDGNSTLVLTTGMNPTRVNYEFTDIGQTVYYDGEAPVGCTLEGVLMAIPYAADITVTLDKTLAEGVYDFTTSVAEVPGSVNRFQIQISEGLPGSEGEPAPKFVTYNTSDMCIFGTLVGETASTVTYKFTGVEDYLLIDSIPQTTLNISASVQPPEGGSTAQSTMNVVTGTGDANEKLTFVHIDGYPDVNKEICLAGLNLSGTTNDGKSFKVFISPRKGSDGKYIWISDYEKNQYVLDDLYVKIDDIEYENLKYDLIMFDRGARFTLTVTGEKPADQQAGANSEKKETVIVINGVLDENKAVSITGTTIDSEPASTQPLDKKKYVTKFTPQDNDFCWLASAVNMMYKAGWLKADPVVCFQKLSEYYFIQDQGSFGSDVTRVFNDYLFKKLGQSHTEQRICKYATGSSEIEDMLDNLASGNGSIVAEFGLSGIWQGQKINHAITCYTFSWKYYHLLGDSGTTLCADSDSGFFTSSSLSNDWKIEGKTKNAKKVWQINYQKKGSVAIGSMVTLISQNYLKANGQVTQEVKLTLDDIECYKEILAARDTYVDGEKILFFAVKYNGVDVDSDSAMISGSSYDSVIPDGGMVEVLSGAEVEKMIVHTGGAVNFYSGSVAKGTIRTAGGTLTVESGVDVSEAEFDFAVSRMRKENNAPLLNSLSNVSGSKLTITIINGQSAGKYMLAGDAADFNGTLSVFGELDCLQSIGKGFDNGLIGELGLDNTLCIEGRTYSLVLEEDNLALVISARQESPLGIVGDFNGDGRAMLVTESDNTFAVYSDGAAWGGLTLDDGWFVAGIGDFNGDLIDDFLRANDEGYVVGEMSNGNGTFSPQVLNFLSEGWDILGVGDFNGNGTDDVLIANPTAASETVGLLGYWSGGTEWTLINGYSAEWECVATGDFNADGKCDMLWRNSFEGEDESIYNAYCTWIVDPSDGLSDWRMVSVANPAEWDFLCSGDFDGDGANDIAMINDVGVVGIWGVNDGYLSSWSILSAVTSEWTLAGVGDFNADGTDDIAWCSATTGQVGCWQIENRELASWQILATLG